MKSTASNRIEDASLKRRKRQEPRIFAGKHTGRNGKNQAGPAPIGGVGQGPSLQDQLAEALALVNRLAAQLAEAEAP